LQDIPNGGVVLCRDDGGEDVPSVSGSAEKDAKEEDNDAVLRASLGLEVCKFVLWNPDT
jgi:hypothetical protein